jgi:hypothetical protein
MPRTFDRVNPTLDVDGVTKRFYDAFQKQHREFLGLIAGPSAPAERAGYASAMLNRLMFVYFVQKQGLLDRDRDYLKDRLGRVRQERGPGQFHTFYCHLLRRLFHEELGRPKAKRGAGLDALLGNVPYLNGGIFDRHELENARAGIDIPDTAFERLFAFFDRYEWHLDDRPPARENEINPDVLGHVFEKYVNSRQEQKEKGAYYTREDITEYIARSTIVPFLLDAAAARCPDAFRPDGPVWRRLRDDPDRYVFEAVRRGADRDLPREVAAGLGDATRRGDWNRPAAADFALPTETWREHVARRRRCYELRRRLRAGAVCAVNDLVTENLDVRQFAADVIDTCDDPALLRALWGALWRVSILDPTCGSGAFLLAALSVLGPLYDACLGRMEALLRVGRRPEEFPEFVAALEKVKDHPNRRFFVLKSIVVNNLYGVDLMQEAAEICKLRLLLKVIAQARTVADLGPLPDVEFNVRVGNALVGFARPEEVGGARAADKADLRARLDGHLAGEYGIDPTRPVPFSAWRRSHRPFHWFGEFFGVMAAGGFDVVIGNPPYVEYGGVRHGYRVRNYATEGCGNLYAFVVERGAALVQPRGRWGLIVPHSAFCTDRMAPLLGLFRGGRTTWVSTYDIRPAKLFAGVDQRLAIYLTAPSARERTFGTRYHRWHEPARPALFGALRYADVSDIDYPNSLAKAGCETELRLWEKLRRRKRLSSGLGGAAAVYYHNAPRYWVRALTFAPYFRNERDGAKLSTQVRRLSAKSRAEAAAVAAALNSSLFYWWFILFSDSRHLNAREIERFPLDVAGMAEGDRRELGDLCARLMEDYRRHAVRKECRYRTTGRVVYDEYYPRHSKPILDEIDRVLARHYGLSGEELDFVLNYDVKYRLGRDGGDEDE